MGSNWCIITIKFITMIRFLTLYVMLPIVLAITDKRPVVPLPNDLDDHIAAVSYKCMLLFQTTSKAIKRFYEFQFPDDELSKKFVYCVCYSTYLAHEDGHLTNLMLSLFDDTEYEDEVKKVFESCNKITRNKATHTLYEVIKCFHKNSPAILGPKIVRRY